MHRARRDTSGKLVGYSGIAFKTNRRRKNSNPRLGYPTLFFG